MTTAPRRPAAATAVALAAVLGIGACSSGAQSTGAGTAAPSTSAPSTAAPSSPGSASPTSPSGSTSSSPGAPDRSQRAAQQSRQAAKQRRKQAARHHKQQARRRQQVQERKRLLGACLDDTETLHSAVDTYNAAVASGSGDQLSAAATTLRKAANKVDHNAERAKNHRLSTLSTKVIHDLGVMAALIDQGEDVSGDQLTVDSRKLRSYCLSRR